MNWWKVLGATVKDSETSEPRCVCDDEGDPDVALAVGRRGGKSSSVGASIERDTRRHALGFDAAAQVPANRAVGKVGQADLKVSLVGGHGEHRIAGRLDRDDHAVGGDHGPERAGTRVPDPSRDSSGLLSPADQVARRTPGMRARHLVALAKSPALEPDNLSLGQPDVAVPRSDCVIADPEHDAHHEEVRVQRLALRGVLLGESPGAAER